MSDSQASVEWLVGIPDKGQVKLTSFLVTGHRAFALMRAALVRKSGEGDESQGWNLFSGVGSSGDGGGSNPNTFLTKFVMCLLEPLALTNCLQ